VHGARRTVEQAAAITAWKAPPPEVLSVPPMMCALCRLTLPPLARITPPEELSTLVPWMVSVPAVASSRPALTTACAPVFENEAVVGRGRPHSAAHLIHKGHLPAAKLAAAPNEVVDVGLRRRGRRRPLMRLAALSERLDLTAARQGGAARGDRRSVVIVAERFGEVYCWRCCRWPRRDRQIGVVGVVQRGRRRSLRRAVDVPSSRLLRFCWRNVSG
jgi:hypothetical protein